MIFEFRNIINLKSYFSQYNSNLNMNTKYKEAAIPLISVDQASGKYVLTKEGQQFIRSVPGPIGVVSVAGLYRTGKSYLLNRMILNRSNGFGVGPTVNPCTKGLWCWGTPIKGESPDGEKLNILVIDTEGIGALDEDQTHDTRIFTLAILASSCFIYNSTGSIDENAIQNLSLVVNLTKHIQLNTQNYGDQDPDKIANYFPKFFWVVRDFSLQMIDQFGNQMSSREYLEKALSPQKGMSEDIQQKNRIRKILTSFFKERQCITLVRPLIDQTKLQELDTIQFDNLRPQFANKVMELRKSITKKMKPKTLNSKVLNGQLYCSMLTSYVGAINSGAVPNIQNAWHYMCQQQCNKILSESYDYFQKMIKDIKIPCSTQEIDRDLENAQEAAVNFFKKESIGDQAQHFYKELITKIKNRSSKLKSINIEEGKTAFKKYISQSMNFITQKINKQQYESIEAFIEEVQKFEEKVTKQQPKFANWDLYLQLSTKKMLQQGSLHFIRKSRNQKEQLLKSSEEKAKINEKQLSSLKSQKQTQDKKNMEQIIQLQKQKIELSRKLEDLQIEISNTNKDRGEEVEKLSRSLTTKKKELADFQQEYQRKLAEVSNKMNQAQNLLHNKELDWEKEKAVFEKQIEQNKEWINQLEKKKHTFDAKFAHQKAELSSKFGEQLMNEKNKVDQLVNELNLKKEDYENLFRELNELKQRLEDKQTKFEINEKKYREQLNSKSKQIQKLINQKELEIEKIRNEFMEKQDEVTKNNRDLEDMLKKSELKTKQLKDELKSQNVKLKHDVALLSQKCQQLSQENEDNIAKIKEMKKVHEQEKEAWEADKGMFKQEQIANKINQIHSQHTLEIQIFKKQQQRESLRLTEQINKLVSANNDYELQNKLLKNNLSNQQKNFLELEEKMNKEISARDKKIKNLQRDFKTQLVEKQMEFRNMMSNKESEIQNEKEKIQSTKMQLENTLNQELITLKTLHQVEKSKLETKANEERQKLNKRNKEQKKKLEETLEEQRQSYEQRIESLEANYENQVRTLSFTIQELRHEKQIIVKERNDLRNKFEATEKMLEKVQVQFNQKYDKLFETAKIEKQILERKNSELETKKVLLQKEELNLNHIKDNLAKINHKQEIQLNQLREEKQKLSNTFEGYKIDIQNKMKEENSLFLSYKKDKETALALLTQEKTFCETHIHQLEKDKEVLISNHKVQLDYTRQQLERQIKLLQEKYKACKQNYEEKIELLKKSNSERQTSLSRKLSELQREMAVTLEKLKNIEGLHAEMLTKKNAEIEQLKKNLTKEKEQRKSELKKSELQIKKLQTEKNDLESEFKEMKSATQIKIKLSQKENINLNQRLEREKRDYNEKMNQLQNSLEEFKKKSENDKFTQESSHEQYRSKIEAKYREERSMLRDELKDKNREIESIRKQNDRLIKQLNEKFAFLNQQKNKLEKKLQKTQEDAQAKQLEFQQQILAIKARIPLIQNSKKEEIEKLQKTQKTKIEDIENKYKIAEQIKQNAVFEKERQQIKWNMEKTSFEEKISELKEQIERLGRDNSKLIQQNEKYKIEKKKNTSQIMARDRTFVYAREIPPDNKQNNPSQL